MRAIPSTWRAGRISDVSAKPQYGWTSSAKPDAVGLPLLRTTDISHGSIDWSVVPRCVTSPPDPSRFMLERNDIVVSRAGSVGLSALIADPPPSVFASYLMRLRPTAAVLPPFLALFLKTPDYWKQISQVTNGIALQNINATKLAAVRLPIPPLDEQRRIVDVLEDHLSRLDAAEHGLELSLRRLSTYEEVALSQCRDGDENPLGEVTQIQGGIQKQPKRAPKQNAYPFLRVANVTKNGLDLDEVHLVELFDGELDRLRLQPGDLLVVEGNGSPSQIGRAALWDGSIADSDLLK